MRDGERRGKTLGGLLARWVERVETMAPWVLLVSLSATALLFLYTVSTLGVSTDTAGMISERLEWRQRYLAYKEDFPQYFEEVVIVIDGQTAELAERARDRLAGRLDREETIRTVYAPGAEEFFRTNGLLYLDAGELRDLSDNLAGVQPFMGRLLDDTTLVGLASVLSDAMDEAAGGEEIDLAPVMLDLAPAFPAAASGQFYRLSWRGLVNGEEDGGGVHRRFIIVQPEIDFSGIQGEKAMDLIRSAAAELGLDPAHGVTVRLTGSVAIANEELTTVSRGMGVATAAALVLVVVILFTALRSTWLVISSVYTLIAGLVATAAFAALAIGTLNLISVAFAVLYIGLGIDYAIHFCLRYRDLVGGGSPHREAIKATAGDVGSSLVICAATTSAGFLAFVPTAYSGVSELGIIAGAGMLISLGANLTLLPAMLYIFPISPGIARQKTGEGRGLDRLREAPLRHRWLVWTVVGAATAASLMLLPRAGFEYNPMKLRPQKGEAVATFNELMAGEDPPLTITAVKDTVEEAAVAKARLKGLATVDRVVTVFDFVPKDQDEKLGIIEEMALLMGPDLARGRYGEDGGAEHSVGDRFAALERLEVALSEFTETGPDENSLAAGILAVNVRDFLDAVEDRPADEVREAVERLEESLLGGLPPLASDLSAMLDADYVTFEDLPPGLVERWVSPSGGYRVEVFPAVDLTDDAEMKRFVGEVRAIEPEATGPVVFMVEAAGSVIDAFTEAFIYALALICLILFIILRRIRSVVLVLVPMLLAGVYTAAATVVLDVPFNFANTIALPLILGLGVDNGVHMVHRARARGAGGDVEGGGSIMATSTVRAIFYSVLTTTAGFGGLAFSPHPGTASIGVLLAVGVLLNLLCTLVFLPTLLERNR